MTGCGKFKLGLFGAFQLTAPDGTVVSLGKKAQALIAIVAVEKGAPLTRSRLQDLLWSLSGPKHGRDSLKKALQAIRKELKQGSAQFLICEGDHVRLNTDVVKVDLEHLEFRSYARSFLEGLDIQEPEFEIWLRSMRQYFDSCKQSMTETPQAHLPQVETATRVRISVRRPTVVGDGMAALMGEVILSRIVDSLALSGLVEVVDLRDADAQSLGGGHTFLSTRTVSAGSELQIQVTLRSASENALLWSRSRYLRTEALAGSNLDEGVCRIVEEILVAARQFSQSFGNETFEVTRLAMEGIENLFRLAPKNLEKASQNFAEAIDIRPSGSLYAWYAFLMPFRYEQRKGADLDGLKEQAEQVSRRALELDPYNPIVRSLLAHVFSFLFRDFEKADALLAPVRNQPPDTPMYHFSESMLHLYSGKQEAARRFAHLAARYGEAHPFSYAFSTSLCMIDALDQRSEKAIEYGQQALAAMPSTGRVYEPTLRYLTAAYAGAGKVDEARLSWRRLQTLNPANNLEQMRENRFPIAANHLRQSLNRSLEQVSRALT